MKKILILSILNLIYFAMPMNAQYINPPQHKIYTYTDTTFTTKDSILISASLPQFKINDFILGWQSGEINYEL